MEHIHLYTKISHLPSNLKSEVNDFIDFLISKKIIIIKKKQPKFEYDYRIR